MARNKKKLTFPVQKDFYFAVCFYM